MGVKKKYLKKVLQKCGKKKWWKKISAAMHNIYLSKQAVVKDTYLQTAYIYKKVKKKVGFKKQSGVNKSGGKQKTSKNLKKSWGKKNHHES